MASEACYADARKAISNKRPQDAIALLTQWLKCRPDDAEALSLLGAAHAARNDYPYALHCLSRSLEIRPCARVLCNLAILYHRQGFLAPAKRALREAAKLDPGNQRALSMLSKIEASEEQEHPIRKEA